jgi:hypothetical protein
VAVATDAEVKAANKNVDVHRDGCFSKTDFDGQLSVIQDEPCAGAVTFSWTPSKETDYPGKAAEVVVPQALFLAVMRAYAASALT